MGVQVGVVVGVSLGSAVQGVAEGTGVQVDVGGGVLVGQGVQVGVGGGVLVGQGVQVGVAVGGAQICSKVRSGGVAPWASVPAPQAQPSTSPERTTLAAGPQAGVEPLAVLQVVVRPIDAG